MNSHDSQSSTHAQNVPVASPATQLTAEQLQFQIAATVDFRTLRSSLLLLLAKISYFSEFSGACFSFLRIQRR